jgi:hypothetical protein
MPAERFDFPNAHGQTLSALLDRPAEGPRSSLAGSADGLGLPSPSLIFLANLGVHP